MTQEAFDAVEVMLTEIARHEEHCWEQVGRCVYCVDCGQRLYQGRIPPEHMNIKKRSCGIVTPKATRDMRARWGMDNR